MRADPAHDREDDHIAEHISGIAHQQGFPPAVDRAGGDLDRKAREEDADDLCFKWSIDI